MANMTSSVSASQVAGELASATFEEIPALVEHYREDPRQQVIKACERALKRHAKELSERERVNGMYELMHELGGDGVVVGVDEVGRGSVAGVFRWSRASGASTIPKSSRRRAASCSR